MATPSVEDPVAAFRRSELVEAFRKWDEEMEANPDDFSSGDDDPAASADYLLRLLRGD
jgi:hypothetical protein